MATEEDGAALIRSINECGLIRMHQGTNAELARSDLRTDDDRVVAVHIFATGETAVKLATFLEQLERESD